MARKCYKVTHTAALNYRRYFDHSLMLAPNWRQKRKKERETEEGKEVGNGAGWGGAVVLRSFSCVLFPT